jgi:hypothetical protein
MGCRLDTDGRFLVAALLGMTIESLLGMTGKLLRIVTDASAAR